MTDNPQFSLVYSDEHSDETYSVYAILLFPNEELKNPQTLAILPVNRETRDINVVNVWGRVMPLGLKAIDASEQQLITESVRDAVVPNLLILLSMSITGYNFLDAEEQKQFEAQSEMEDKLDVEIDELPDAPEFTFDSPADLFNAIGE